MRMLGPQTNVQAAMRYLRQRYPPAPWTTHPNSWKAFMPTITNLSPPRCRQCGCLDIIACRRTDGGPEPTRCWWIEPDLCSACAGPSKDHHAWTHPPVADTNAAWQGINDAIALRHRLPHDAAYKHGFDAYINDPAGSTRPHPHVHRINKPATEPQRRQATQRAYHRTDGPHRDTTTP